MPLSIFLVKDKMALHTVRFNNPSCILVGTPWLGKKERKKETSGEEVNEKKEDEVGVEVQ